MQHDLVTDGYIVSDDELNARVGMQHAAVLDVAAFSDGEPVIVSAQYAIEPDAGFVLQADAANDGRIVCHEMTGALKFRGAVTECVDHCALPWAATAAAALAMASGSPRNSREIGFRSSSSS